ncbi:MAG: dTMP kinase [Spirochaetae bacterium HGW-Spirochaetae-8]|nr:MAG: dTMP kinase [Spirochaetae bacterium HGW-Spirochaetae-8]
MQDILDRFVVFEGLDGAGTTTQMKLMAEAFDKAGTSCHATFEPTASPLGSLVRSVLKKQVVTTPLALALLFAADREDHLNHPITGVVEKVRQGIVVLCDRYLYSSLSYQSIECGFERVSFLNDFPAPKFLFYIDTPVEVCLRRIEERSDEREIFEKQEFLQKVRDNYELIFSSLPDGIVFTRIDGTLGKEEIGRKALQVLKDASLL